MNEKAIEIRLAQCRNDILTLSHKERELEAQLEGARNPRSFDVCWDSGNTAFNLSISKSNQAIRFHPGYDGAFSMNLDVCRELHEKLGFLICTARKANTSG